MLEKKTVKKEKLHKYIAIISSILIVIVVTISFIDYQKEYMSTKKELEKLHNEYNSNPEKKPLEVTEKPKETEVTSVVTEKLNFEEQTEAVTSAETESITSNAGRPATFTNVYSKLEKKSDINVAIIGDSTGFSEGVAENEKWYNLLSSDIKKKYGSKVNFTNLSTSGGVSFGGYYKVMMNDLSSCDLAFISFYYNDLNYDINDFYNNYEAIIRNLKKKNHKIEIIPIVYYAPEYDAYTNAIIEISNFYKLSYIDLINTYKTANIDINTLKISETFFNNIGYNLFFESVKKIIDENVTNKKEIKAIDLNNVLRPDVIKYDNFKYTDFTQLTNVQTDYILNTEADIVGFSYELVSSNGGYVDMYLNRVCQSSNLIEHSVFNDKDYCSMALKNLEGPNEVIFRVVTGQNKYVKINGVIEIN